MVFSVNRANVVAFHEKHHGLRDGSSLRDHIDALMSEAGLTRPENVELLCYPSVLGFTFNPISVYFCRDAKGELTALIYQVHNTFGESHTYVEPVREGQASAAGIRQERDKQFYVSPFMDMAMRYRFRILPPGQTVALRILETDSVGPMLSASFHGRRSDATTAALLTAVLKTAGITWKVVAGIHWEALKLWIKGMKLRPRPAPPPLASFPDAPMRCKTGLMADAWRRAIAGGGT